MSTEEEKLLLIRLRHSPQAPAPAESPLKVETKPETATEPAFTTDGQTSWLSNFMKVEPRYWPIM